MNTNIFYLDIADNFIIRDSDDGDAPLFDLDADTRTLVIGTVADQITTTYNGDLLVSGYIQTATGGGDSGIKIGDDCWINDVDRADTLCLVGGQTPANAVLMLGSGEDTNLYRSAANTLKTDDNFVIGTISAAGLPSDKYLVSDTGQVKYRTAAQVLSDIGGGPGPDGTYTRVYSAAAWVMGGHEVGYENYVDLSSYYYLSIYDVVARDIWMDITPAYLPPGKTVTITNVAARVWNSGGGIGERMYLYHGDFDTESAGTEYDLGTSWNVGSWETRNFTTDMVMTADSKVLLRGVPGAGWTQFAAIKVTYTIT